jgi:prevent-host-death family protein
MTTVNMLDAKTRLSQLVQAVESGAETEIVIARNGKPAARLVRMAHDPGTNIRFGVAKGLFPPMGDPFALDDEVAALFEASHQDPDA